MIRLENVFKAFGENLVLRGVSFTIERGEFIGVVGPSGGGKSVLLKVLGRVLSPSSGTVEATGQQGVGFLFQEGALFDSMTVLENVAFPLLSQPDPVGLSEAYQRAYDILEQVGLAKAYEKVPGQLSGGMRRRVALARALVNRPELVLLDDPTGGLDPVAASVIIALIKELAKLYNLTVVFVSHDIRRLLPNVNRVLGLFDGRIACDLPPHELVAKAPEHVVKFLATRFDFDAFRNASHP